MSKRSIVYQIIILILVFIILLLTFKLASINNSTKKDLNDTNNSEGNISIDSFSATISEVNETSFTVKANEDELPTWFDIIVVLFENEYNEKFNVGDKIVITFNGQVMLTEPPQVFATKIEKISAN